LAAENEALCPNESLAAAVECGADGPRVDEQQTRILSATTAA